MNTTAASKTWTRTMKNLDPEKTAPWITWTLKNLHSEKHGINTGLKNMYDFRELCFKKIMRNVICCLKVHRYLTKFFRLKIIFIIINSKTEVLKTWRWFMFFKFYGSLKTKSTFPLIKCSQRSQQYGSSEKICLELKDLMS